MNANPPAGSALAPSATVGPTTPKKGPPKFKQRQTRTFKSKAPKPGQKGTKPIEKLKQNTRGALVTTSPAWRDLARTSQWCAHGKPSATWSSATWPNTASSSLLPSSPACTSLPCPPLRPAFSSPRLGTP
ncbi:hypothetical protein FQN60_003507 [Etheostoma spectabile]|uniref:Retinal cone rhodopsin-sensitive cGMP 3',5'-cyclic phosphodiesterase subunit gamma n=1 Tax=Etheostoma spectabile TaxID=54343 RepID=A0A5J5CVF9_9PERO|nr:hypothetical protein FQN60_003507 [Etheostoma spectabile]